MNPSNRPKAIKLVDDLVKTATSYGCETKVETIVHKTSYWPQLRIADTRAGMYNGHFLLTAGIHGTEIAGPLTIKERFPEILACARVSGLRLICYPLMNPSGYDNGTDRNIDGDGGDGGNNDYLRYQLFDGSWTWNLLDDHSVKAWRWSSDPIVSQRLPAETALMHESLKREDWDKVKIALDIHQDNLTQGTPAGAYHYPFGNVSRYTDIINHIRTFTQVLGNYDFRFNRDKPEEVVRSDQNGCIVFHDGTLADLAYRIGVRDALTIETTGALPLHLAMEVNMTWIRGLVDLIRLNK